MVLATGSSGRVMPGIFSDTGNGFIAKLSSTPDGLRREMEMYAKLEATLRKDGDGDEPTIPVLVGRFRSMIDAEDMMVMEDSGSRMPPFAHWTVEEK